MKNLKSILSLTLVLLFAGGEAGAQIRLTETGGGSDSVSLSAPSSTGSNVTWILPANYGANNNCLVTNAAGTLSWIACSGTANALNASDGNPVNALYSEAAGRIGIGITTPTSGTILDINGTGTAGSAILLPNADTASRPASPVNGMLRYNTTLQTVEGYQNNEWTDLYNGFAGKVEIAAAANCRWLNTATGSFANLAADTDCGAITASGGATAPGTKIPAIILNNLPAGDYEVVANASFKMVNTGRQCRWRFSDGTNVSGVASSNNNFEAGNTMRGTFSYGSNGNRTIQIQILEVGGNAGACSIDNNEATYLKFEIYVKRL